MVEILNSQIDDSVNFIETISDVSATEARFVRRVGDYFIAYVSAQTACEMACRFCHLTATGQVKPVDVDVAGIVSQASQVMSYYDQTHRVDNPARKVHFNFMARGEPLDSVVLRTQGDEVVNGLHQLAVVRDLVAVTKISTIMPTHCVHDFYKMFPTTSPDIYYSLYSVDESFRRRWLPKAAGVDDALNVLDQWCSDRKKTLTLHHALIRTPDGGGNWKVEDAQAIVQRLSETNLRPDVNLVRYNPPTPKHGQDAGDEAYEAYADVFRQAWPTAHVKTVARVGFDVAASCGMFVGGRKKLPLSVV